MNAMKTFFLSPSAMALLGALSLAACSSTPPTNAALEEARARVAALNQDPAVARYAPLELQRARDALDRAQTLWNGNGEPAAVDHRAYLASRQAEVARSAANLRQARQAIEGAETERAQVLLAARTQQAQQAQQQAQQLQQELAALQAQQTPRGMVITLGNVLFRTDSAELIPGAAATIDRLAEFMRRNPEATVQIEGHTDSTGSETYNLGLSQRRADAVRSALVSRGIEPHRIETQGLGQSMPIASNDTAQGRQLNRRVEVVVSAPGLPGPAAGAASGASRPAFGGGAAPTR